MRPLWSGLRGLADASQRAALGLATWVGMFAALWNSLRRLTLQAPNKHAAPSRATSRQSHGDTLAANRYTRYQTTALRARALSRTSCPARGGCGRRPSPRRSGPSSRSPSTGAARAREGQWEGRSKARRAIPLLLRFTAIFRRVLKCFGSKLESSRARNAVVHALL